MSKRTSTGRVAEVSAKLGRAAFVLCAAACLLAACGTSGPSLAGQPTTTHSDPASAGGV